MGYSVEFVQDVDFPAGHDFVLLETPEGVSIYFRSSAVTPTTLEAAWAAYRAILDSPMGDPDRLTLRPPVQLSVHERPSVRPFALVS